MNISVHKTERIMVWVQEERILDRQFRTGFVLQATGDIVENELAQLGRDLDDWIIEETVPDGTVGVMIWEGKCYNAENKFRVDDWEPRLSGKWRVPTLEELSCLVPVVLNDSVL